MKKMSLLIIMLGCMMSFVGLFAAGDENPGMMAEIPMLQDPLTSEQDALASKLELVSADIQSNPEISLEDKNMARALIEQDIDNVRLATGADLMEYQNKANAWQKASMGVSSLKEALPQFDALNRAYETGDFAQASMVKKSLNIGLTKWQMFKANLSRVFEKVKAKPLHTLAGGLGVAALGAGAYYGGKRAGFWGVPGGVEGGTSVDWDKMPVDQFKTSFTEMTLEKLNAMNYDNQDAFKKRELQELAKIKSTNEIESIIESIGEEQLKVLKVILEDQKEYATKAQPEGLGMAAVLFTDIQSRVDAKLIALGKQAEVSRLVQEKSEKLALAAKAEAESRASAGEAEEEITGEFSSRGLGIAKIVDLEGDIAESTNKTLLNKGVDPKTAAIAASSAAAAAVAVAVSSSTSTVTPSDAAKEDAGKAAQDALKDLPELSAEDKQNVKDVLETLLADAIAKAEQAKTVSGSSTSTISEPSTSASTETRNPVEPTHPLFGLTGPASKSKTEAEELLEKQAAEKEAADAAAKAAEEQARKEAEELAKASTPAPASTEPVLTAEEQRIKDIDQLQAKLDKIDLTGLESNKDLVDRKNALQESIKGLKDDASKSTSGFDTVIEDLAGDVEAAKPAIKSEPVTPAPASTEPVLTAEEQEERTKKLDELQAKLDKIDLTGVKEFPKLQDFEGQKILFQKQIDELRANNKPVSGYDWIVDDLAPEVSDASKDVTS